MLVPILECAGCFAPVKKGQSKCDFCGSEFAIDWEKVSWAQDDSGIELPVFENGSQKGIVSAKSIKRIATVDGNAFEKSFMETFSIKKQRFSTRILIYLYEKDDDLASLNVIDAKKAGLENIASFLAVTSKTEVSFADLLKTLNDRYIEIAVEKNETSGTVGPVFWYKRNIHLENIINVLHESGFQVVRLYERKKKDPDKDGKINMTFPIAHKMQFVADSIFDMASKRFLKCSESWPWRESKMEPASFYIQDSGKKW